jgi:hypothetical protein
MKLLKGGALLLVLMFALYGFAGMAGVFGNPELKTFLDAQAASLSAQYHANQAAQAAADAAAVVSETAVQ